MMLLKTTWARLHKAARLGAMVALLSVTTVTFSANAQQSSGSEVEDRGWRWFEVEVVVFRNRNTQSSETEQFSLQIEPFNVAASRDLLSSRFAKQNLTGYITALPRCAGSKGFIPIVRNQLLSVTELSNELANYTPDSFACHRHDHMPLVQAWYQGTREQFRHSVASVPRIVLGAEAPSKEALLAADVPFLVHPNHFRFNNIRQQLERRQDTEVLLHTAWVQPVFARNRGRKIRLFGGHNFSEEFDFFGFPKERANREQLLEQLRFGNVYGTHSQRVNDEANASSVELFNDIERLFTAIEQREFHFVDYADRDVNLPVRPSRIPAGTPEDVWEFDGLLEIYLVGNYLHIAPEFNLREVIELNPSARSPEQQVDDFLNQNDNSLRFLRNYSLNQLRRVISHQVHYFDHPHYSMAIEIRRTDLSTRR